MQVKPLSDRVLVKPLSEEQATKAGIIIPDTVEKEKPEKGEVIAVGPGRFEDGKRIPLDVKKGDKVLMGKYSGSEVKIDGTDYIIIREEEVLAIVS